MFSQVKIDESSNLEHVTRTRPKANRNRRPPTRIHMKEVCVCLNVRSSICKLLWIRVSAKLNQIVSVDDFMLDWCV